MYRIISKKLSILLVIFSFVLPHKAFSLEGTSFFVALPTGLYTAVGVLIGLSGLSGFLSKEGESRIVLSDVENYHVTGVISDTLEYYITLMREGAKELDKLSDDDLIKLLGIRAYMEVSSAD